MSGNNHTRYYGHTNNLTKRLNEHLKGRVQSTRDKQPIELVYYKEFNSRSEAFKREMQFKNGKTREKTIEKLINSFPKTKCQGFISHSDLPVNQKATPATVGYPTWCPIKAWMNGFRFRVSPHGGTL